MAMTLPSRAADRRVLSEINVTPLVDVTLVLLIIFMVTTPMLQRGTDVQLPQAHVEHVPEEVGRVSGHERHSLGLVQVYPPARGLLERMRSPELVKVGVREHDPLDLLEGYYLGDFLQGRVGEYSSACVHDDRVLILEEVYVALVPHPRDVVNLHLGKGNAAVL